MKIEYFVGFGVLAALAYLGLRSKGSDSVPKSDAIKKVELQALQSKEDALQFALEDEPKRISQELQNTNKLLGVESGFLSSYTNSGLTNHTDIFVKENAQNQIRFFQNKVQNLQSKRANLIDEANRIFINANQIIETQNFYNQPTLNEIRQQLNSSATL